METGAMFEMRPGEVWCSGLNKEKRPGGCPTCARLGLKIDGGIEQGDSYVAEQKAAREERDRIIRQYKDHGYAENKFEVTDEEEEV